MQSSIILIMFKITYNQIAITSKNILIPTHRRTHSNHLYKLTEKH